MKKLLVTLALAGLVTAVWSQSEESDPTTLEKIRILEAALASPDGGLPLVEDWDNLIEDARNAGNRELEIRARSAVAGLRLRQRRALPTETDKYLEEAWQRETERRSSEFKNGIAGIGSTISLGVFVVGATAASGGLVLGDQFWKEFVTAAPGSDQASDAYGRMATADYVSFFGSLTAITGAVGFVVFELLKD